jgi:hypothetical protein
MMTDAQKIQLQRWWMEQIREITRKEMKAEEKRQERQKKKTAKMFGDLEIEKPGDIDDLYGCGAITSRQRDRLIDAFEGSQGTDEMYDAKMELLQDAYSEAQQIMRDLGQEV